MTSVEYPHLQGEASRHRGGEGVTYSVVYGEDGRRVGLFVRDELNAFKQRITHMSNHNIFPAADPRWPNPDTQPPLRRELFTIVPVDGAGNTVGEPEEWTPPQAA